MPWTGPVLPALPGLTFPRKRNPNWSSVKNDSLSNRRTRFSLVSYPTYSFEIPISYLKTDALTLQWQTLMGFINSLNGTVGLFGYADPLDQGVSGQEFAVGDGSTLGPFQLVRGLGGFVEPVFLLNGAPTIQVAGVTSSSWTVDGYGRVTFTTGNAPANGAALTWSGSYFWPCRFDDDTTNFDQFFSNMLEVKALKFTSEKLP